MMGRSKQVKARKAIIAMRVRFFFKHAGYSYDPKTETALQGRWRCARELARAEAYAQAQGWRFSWEDDWSVGSHAKEYGADREPSTCEMCMLLAYRDNHSFVDPHDSRAWTALASLGCIDDATPEYRRVIEAELASEALFERESSLERESNSAADVPIAR